VGGDDGREATYLSATDTKAKCPYPPLLPPSLPPYLPDVVELPVEGAHSPGWCGLMPAPAADGRVVAPGLLELPKGEGGREGGRKVEALAACKAVGYEHQTPSLPPYLRQVDVVVKDLGLALIRRGLSGRQFKVEVDHVLQLEGEREGGRGGGG